MQSSLVYALHGFLGKSTDWDFIKNELQNIQPGVNFIAEDLFAKKSAGDFFINFFIKNETFNFDFDSYQGKKIFLGYSLGGRLGLQILKKSPQLFDQYIFLSTNPGLPTTATEERKNRILNDQMWSEKINLENWDNFLQEWNSQVVFQDSKQDPWRDVNNYDLQKLKEGIVNWSLGNQDDFSDILKLNNKKITWVVGDRDKKYCQIAQQMQNKKIFLSYKQVSAGHRIWLDNPMAVVEILAASIDQADSLT